MESNRTREDEGRDEQADAEGFHDAHIFPVGGAGGKRGRWMAFGQSSSIVWPGIRESRVAGKTETGIFFMISPTTLLIGLVIFLALQSVLLSLYLARNFRAQQALAEAERDYHSLFDNAIDGIYRSSLDGRQLRANPALVRLNGYESEEEMLRAVNDIAREWYVDPGRRAEFKRLMDQNGSVENFVSEIYRHRTRERIWISENARLVRDRKGQPLFYEGTVRDISSLRRIDQELIKARQEAEAGNAAKSRLLANASHELRSPLTRLGLAIEMPGEAPERLAEIRRNLAELDQLIEEILLASRLDRPETPERRESVDLLALAAEEAARTGAAASGQAIEVTGDPRLLRRLIRNLLENAVKHGAPPVEITVGRSPEGRPKIAVTDRGAGIPAAEQARIFEPFHRPAGRGEAAGSWGLGLALVRQIAERHGGFVRCEGRNGGGSAFVVELAAEKPASTGSA